jgi:hypothetical protein
MKIVVTCAGEQHRWNNYMGVPKQMAPILGVPLLQRTIQAMNKLFPDSDVYVSVQNQSKKEFYIVDGKYEFYVLPQFNSDEAALKSLVPLYKQNGDDFLVMLGDVAFSQDCIDKIYNVIKKEQAKGPHEVKIFGRKSLSNSCYHKFGELFAFYIPHQVKIKFIEAIEIVDKYYNLKLLNRKTGWEIMSCYFSKSKEPTEIQKLRRRKSFPALSFITIDDETDDFDLPREYDDYISKIERKALRLTSKSWISTAPAQFFYLLLSKIKTTIEKAIIASASKFLPVPVKTLVKKIVGWDKFYS